MDDWLSLKRAREYLLDLPRQLDRRLDGATQLELNALLARFEEFFNVAGSIDRHAGDSVIDAAQATEICDFGCMLLGRLLETAVRLDLPDEHREIERISLAIVHWAIRHGATLNDPGPAVNVIARLAASLRDRRALLALSSLITDIIEHCAPGMKQGREGEDDAESWRDLHSWRGEVAIRSGDPATMKQAFDEFLLYLPRQALTFLAARLRDAESRNYPPRSRELIADYLGRVPLGLR